MKHAILLLLACAGLATPEVHASELIVEGDISIATTWTADNIYLLRGWVYVTSGATLTIQPGTIIKGEQATKGSLIIQRGGLLIADGTLSAPIIFTSERPASQRAAGDWGGIILCGQAPVNLPGGEGQIEGGVEAMFGGTDPDDSSGVIRYVRIEFPGAAFLTNVEINGLTLAGVGRGTIIDHVQVSHGGDDSFEFLGGTVDAKHLYSYTCLDDDLDMTNGYSGRVQFAVGLRDPDLADVTGSNALENDNDDSGTSASPYTSPLISNMSVFGPQADVGTVINLNYKRANHLRRNTRSRIFNSVFAGFPVGLLVDGAACETNADAGMLKVRNNVYSAMGILTAVAGGSTWDVATWFSGHGNTALGDNIALGYADPFNMLAPDFALNDQSSLANGADFIDAELGDPFFEQVTYQGAFGSTDWTVGWSNTDPQSTSYVVVIPERSTGSEVIICPNPMTAASLLRFGSSPGSQLTLQFYDAQGRLVVQRLVATGGGSTVPLGFVHALLNPGPYYLRILDDGSSTVVNVMVR